MIENLTHDVATLPHPFNLSRRFANNRHFLRVVIFKDAEDLFRYNIHGLIAIQ
jgi:hypothetical protein